jgi:hypothetical protein
LHCIPSYPDSRRINVVLQIDGLRRYGRDETVAASMTLVRRPIKGLGGNDRRFGTLVFDQENLMRLIGMRLICVIPNIAGTLFEGIVLTRDSVGLKEVQLIYSYW